MGHGRWSSDTYDAAARYRRARGESAFAYSDSGARKVHPRLDPYRVAVRESRDSNEHPRSTAIAVLFDVTGSMGHVPRVLQTKLPGLLNLIRDKGYATDPQILFGAIGDATCDKVPLQVGQFESDNRMDEDLGLMVLEGGGGGQRTESYELAMYFMSRHTSIDCWEKRGRKGYLFIIGDEMPYKSVKPREVEGIIGDRAELIPVTQMVAELQQTWDVYYLMPEGSSYAGDQQILSTWRKLLGQNVIELEDLDAVCEVIGLTVGLGEGAIDLDAGLTDLVEVGSGAREVVARALDRRWI
jgi:hypothetical protein